MQGSQSQLEAEPRVAELPFDSDKPMITVHSTGDQYFAITRWFDVPPPCVQADVAAEQVNQTMAKMFMVQQWPAGRFQAAESSSQTLETDLTLSASSG